MRTVDSFPARSSRPRREAGFWDDAAQRLYKGEVLAFDAADFDGRTPQKFRVNVHSCMQARGMQVKTRIVDDVVYVVLV